MEGGPPQPYPMCGISFGLGFTAEDHGDPLWALCVRRLIKHEWIVEQLSLVRPGKVTAGSGCDYLELYGAIALYAGAVMPRLAGLPCQPSPLRLGALGRQGVEPIRQRGKGGDCLLDLRPLGFYLRPLGG